MCMLLQGRSQSCMFTGVCSDLFTQVAMLHLCSSDLEQSLPARMFRKLLGKLRIKLHISDLTPPASEFQRSCSADSTDTRSSVSTSPLLQCLEDADEIVPGDLIKDDDIAALQERIRNLEHALARVAGESRETARKSTPDPASPSGTPYRTAAASLIQNGVPVISASAVDLDLSRKPLLGRGVYSEVCTPLSRSPLLACSHLFCQAMGARLAHTTAPAAAPPSSGSAMRF
jgi:hypothetical protein